MTAYDEMPTGASCSNVMLMLKLMLKVCKVKVIGLNVVSNMRSLRLIHEASN